VDEPRAELYLYCVRRAEHPPPGELAGVGGAPTLHLVRGSFSAWFARLPRLAPDEPALRAHEAVMRAALRTATPVPMRFGTWLAGTAALEQLLEREGERLLALLARVGGRVEMGVRAVDVGEAASPPRRSTASAMGPGRSYLERRRAEMGVERGREARAGALSLAVRSRLESEGSEVLATLVPDADTLFELSFLIDRGRVRSFRECFDRLSPPAGGVDLTLSGPWAPYSFVTTGSV
jgi:hypothetical protein